MYTYIHAYIHTCTKNVHIDTYYVCIYIHVNAYKYTHVYIFAVTHNNHIGWLAIIKCRPNDCMLYNK